MYKQISIGVFTVVFWALMAGYALAQCTGIDFSASDNPVCAPKLVRFYSQNIPAGSTVEWDYGSGFTNGKDTGQFIFTSPGTYAVSLRVTLSDGVTECVVNKANFVTVYQAPTPLFSVSRKVLCNGADTVTITDQSTGGTSRSWVVEGLPVADTSKSIVYSFNSAGYKDILLILNSANCPTSYYSVDSAVRVYNTLNFDFSSDTNSGCAPANFTYSAKNITAGHTVATYSWTFGGAVPATSNLANPVVNYATAGTYSVGLTITNTDGCSQTVNKGNYLQLGDTVNFSVINSKTNACRNERITLDVSDPTLPGSFLWDLGNGTPQQGSTSKHQVVEFNDTGYQFYKVSRNYNGCITVRSYNKQVYITPPRANFSVINSVECDPNARVYVFNTTKIDPSATHTYTWNFYSGTNNLQATSADSVPIFFTNGNGFYSLELVVTSSKGCVDTLKVDNVIIRSNGVGSFIAVPETSCPGGQVGFISNSPAFSSGEPNVHYWTVYDKDGVTVLHTQSTGIIPRLNYTFNDTGEYSVSLLVYNSKCSDTVRRAKTVKIVKPTTTVNISDDKPCTKTPINFTANSTPAATGSGYSYTWKMLNPSDTSAYFNAQGQTATITADTGGVYDLQTIVKWGLGCADTLYQTARVQVSAPVFTIASSSYNDCRPMVATATSTMLYNHNYKNPANAAMQYSWSATPVGGTIFVTPNAATSQVTYTGNGSYTLRLIAENGSGCRDTAYTKQLIHVGVFSDFSLSATSVCTGDTLAITNLSRYKPDRFQWFSNPAGVIFNPAANVEAPKAIFPDSGYYNITLVTSKKNTCFDTVTKQVRSVKIIADFSSNDTQNYCAPTNVLFTSTSKNADSLTWYLGDGKTIRTPNVATLPYIYFKNSGSNGFDVKLVAKNKLGCKDSTTRLGYVRIDGPVPDYSLDITKGCEPVSVTITDRSLSYSEYYFDYGDGSKFDTTGNPGTHVYTANNSLTEITKYQPRLFLLDPLGCFSENIYPFQVEIYRTPQVKFIADTLQGCVPLTVRFTDSSKFVQRYQWDFESDGIIDDTARNPVYTYTKTGFKTVKLNARSQYGCITTDSLINYIEVFALPQAAFNYSKFDNDTANIYYDFQNQSSNYNSLQWYVDSVQVSTAENFRFPFTDTGRQTMRLLAISAQGCVDTADERIYVTPDYFFYIPNAFTPNQREANETFGPYGPLWARKYVMRIYNRYGQLLFETNKVEQQWDGTFKNQPCQQDMYLYNIEYMDMFSRWHVFRGTVMLIR